MKSPETRKYYESMARLVSQQEFVETANDLIQSAGQQTVFIQNGGETVAVLVSPSEYESTHEAKVEKAIAAMKRLSDAIYENNPSEAELYELEKALDRKA